MRRKKNPHFFPEFSKKTENFHFIFKLIWTEILSNNIDFSSSSINLGENKAKQNVWSAYLAYFFIILALKTPKNRNLDPFFC